MSTATHLETADELLYRSLDDIQILTAEDLLYGGLVVSGFRCRVGELFTALDG
jgi:hypothetical protein